MSLWDSLLELVGRLVSPDWGALVALIPLALLLAVGAYLLWVLRRYATAGPQVSRALPVPPPPSGIHVPGPSLAPFLAAGGAFCFLLAALFVSVEPAVDSATGKPIPDSTTIVLQPFGVVALVVGLGALIGALLYWGREANREYDALEPPTALPAVVREGPPAGVHVPGPSFRPLLVSIAAAVLLLGLVLGLAVLAAGVVMLVIALVGWLVDARGEFREAVRADATGHLENIPAPRFPTGTLILFAALFVGSLLVTAGIFPPREASGGDGGSPAPPSAAPATQAPGGGSASPAPSASAAPGESQAPGESVTLDLGAQGIAFDTDTLEVPADTPFRIAFTNNDAGIPHNVAIHKDSPTGPEVWKGDIFNGVETRTYEVPALPAGTYGFVCTVHPNMTGTLTVR